MESKGRTSRTRSRRPGPGIHPPRPRRTQHRAEPSGEDAEQWAPPEDTTPAARTEPATGEWAPPIGPGSRPEAGAAAALEQAGPSLDDATEDDLRRRLERAEAEAAEAAERAERYARERDEAEGRAQQASAAGESEADVDDPVEGDELGAAEARFAEIIAARESELQREREEKIEAIENADRRLREIEERAAEAAERLTAAEQALADEAERLRAEAAAELERATSEARERARLEADQRTADREAQLERAAADATEARSAAAEWLRSQATALRQEGEREGRSGLEQAVKAAREQGAADAERRLRAAIHKRGAEPAAIATEDRDQTREQRFRAAAERLAGEGAGAQPAGSRKPNARAGAGRGRPGARVSLADASFEQLRGTGLSVREAKRVLRYRDERGLSSTAALAEIPGLSADAVDELRTKLTD